MNSLQQQVQETLDGLVESGAERGLQVSVYRKGEPVVDAMAGVADHETGIAFALTKNRLTADFGAAEQVAGIVARAVAES